MLSIALVAGVVYACVVFVILKLCFNFFCCYCIVRLSVIICCNFTTTLLYIPFFSFYLCNFFTFVSLINKKYLKKNVFI